MYKGKKVIAIIPARSGSKGLPDKNTKELAGKPMLSYSIEAAQKAGVFDEIFVSTDSQIYAEIAIKYRASVPFLRSAEMATDTASSWDVVLQSLDRYRDLGKEFDIVVLLQPTSPLRSCEDILNALKLVEEKEANAIISVCETDHSPLWVNKLPEDGCMSGFLKIEAANKTRQALDTFYRINGAIYVVNIKNLKHNSNLYDEKCFAYIMPKERSIDIDDMFDFICAEALMKYL